MHTDVFFMRSPAHRSNDEKSVHPFDCLIGGGAASAGHLFCGFKN